MSLFNIDTGKCERDAICVATCPMGLIKINDKNAYPSRIENAEEVCFNCGHCVAVCPKGALSLKTMQPENCFPINREILPDAKKLKHFLIARRTVRKYKSKPVDRQIIDDIIDTARYAPSGFNVQPVNWIVIQNYDDVHRLSEMAIEWMRKTIKERPLIAAPLHMDLIVKAWDNNGENKITGNAPHAIFAHSAAAMTADRHVGESACIIALTYLELASFSMGLGAFRSGLFRLAANYHKPLKQALEIPKDHQCFGAMVIGYPMYDNYFHRIPLRNEAIINWL